MAEQRFEEKRTYVRADLATRVKIEPISTEEFERQKAALTGDSANDVCTDGERIPDVQLDRLTQRLMRIEEKLDRIIRKIDPDSRPEETATYGVAQNISGAGINLILKDTLELGQLVLISLSVPGFTIGFLQAYGEVTRVKPKTDRGRQFFETSIKFIIINEAEREKLISYAFCQQRQKIRDHAAKREKDLEPQNNGR